MKYPNRQHDGEFAAFTAILAAEGAVSYLEIGSMFGGSLWLAAKTLPKGSLIVAVDLPLSRGNQKTLQSCVNELCADGYDAKLIVGDSASPDVISAVRALAPFDACFIDANHKLKNVTADWINYGPMAHIVAFHDISGLQEKGNEGAPQFWQSIKGDYKHREIKLDHKPNRGGIGVLWR